MSIYILVSSNISDFVELGEMRHLSSGRNPTTQMILPEASSITNCRRLSNNDLFRSVRKSLTNLFPFIPNGQKRSPIEAGRNVRGNCIQSASRQTISGFILIVKSAPMGCIFNASLFSFGKIQLPISGMTNGLNNSSCGCMIILPRSINSSCVGDVKTRPVVCFSEIYAYISSI